MEAAQASCLYTQPMKVAYILATNLASTTKLATMILPQLEQGNHGADIAGIFFFDDNLFCLRAGDPIGERLARIAQEKNILLMACDQCAVRRNLAEGKLEQCGSGQVTPKNLVAGAHVGCFPQLYAALSDSPPDYVITL
jgi:sulfur relay (sulfurtransferase) complex TusBCD TusD component (DsrE family)